MMTSPSAIVTDRRDAARRQSLEARLDSIDQRLDSGDERMSDIGERLATMQERQDKFYETFARHMYAWCAIADAAHVIARPFAWALGGTYRALLVLGAGAAAAYGVWLLLDRVQAAVPWT